MTHLTTATITYPIADNTSTECTFSFMRPNRFLTYRGVQKMISRGCEETEFIPRPDMTVTRIETAYLS